MCSYSLGAMYVKVTKTNASFIIKRLQPGLMLTVKGTIRKGSKSPLTFFTCGVKGCMCLSQRPNKTPQHIALPLTLAEEII